MSNPVSKRMKSTKVELYISTTTDIKVIGTHSGTFHCDGALYNEGNECISGKLTWNRGIGSIPFTAYRRIQGRRFSSY